MDDIARFNKERWEELARAKVNFSRPMLDLDEQSARELVDPEGMLGEVTGKDVLCLAGGGGQQSAAFTLLGASVTVLDLCETQLERDRQAATHYGVQVRTVQGDMRDLSPFADESFDIVWHAHSINFVPDARAVFREAARVLRPGGLYRLSCWNPFYHGLHEGCWDGRGYSLRVPFADGAEVTSDDPYWTFHDETGAQRRVEGPREFRHALSTLVNGLIEQGFVIRGMWEGHGGDPEAEPGTWDHMQTIAPPWLTLWAERKPEVAGRSKEKRE